MIQIVLWTAGLGLAIIGTQYLSMLAEATLKRRDALQKVDLAYEREDLRLALLAVSFLTLYVGVLLLYLLFYLQMRETGPVKQTFAVLAVLLIMTGISLRPQKDMHGQKNYWLLLWAITAVWTTGMVLHICGFTAIVLGSHIIPLP